uniref:Uncharacterized protein n=1 Tax=Babesia bovis TaxID=5865 RepID=S6BGM2_BABBO|nr:hypothetical protein [Babesia bovis]
MIQEITSFKVLLCGGTRNNPSSCSDCTRGEPSGVLLTIFGFTNSTLSVSSAKLPITAHRVYHWIAILTVDKLHCLSSIKE